MFKLSRMFKRSQNRGYKLNRTLAFRENQVFLTLVKIGKLWRRHYNRFFVFMYNFRRFSQWHNEITCLARIFCYVTVNISVVITDFFSIFCNWNYKKFSCFYFYFPHRVTLSGIFVLQNCQLFHQNCHNSLSKLEKLDLLRRPMVKLIFFSKNIHSYHPW